mmetsp:Transcript_6271/g.17562  ORF Transcript_6271/g.17562 Transcript_6271/m.17562 type:complete len:320 (+) Transcript_6271:684-1643(+)
MTTVEAPNVRVISFEGGGDDMDAPIKAINTDAAFRDKHGLCSINSINWGRVAVQTVHWFFSYFRACEASGRGVGTRMHFVVPTGAMGNVAAGFIAREMGLPANLTCGVNANDIVHRCVARGQFHRAGMHRTISQAINIQVPYNMERVLYYLGGRDPTLTRGWMHIMDTTGKLTLRGPHLRALRAALNAESVTDGETAAVMRGCYEGHGYLCDPHTAVAISAGEKLGLLDGAPQAGGYPVVVLATAHAAKFEGAVRRSLGDGFWEGEFLRVHMPESARELEQKPEVGGAPAGKLFRVGEDWVAQLRTVVETGFGVGQSRL